MLRRALILLLLISVALIALQTREGAPNQGTELTGNTPAPFNPDEPESPRRFKDSRQPQPFDKKPAEMLDACAENQDQECSDARNALALIQASGSIEEITQLLIVMGSDRSADARSRIWPLLEEFRTPNAVGALESYYFSQPPLIPDRGFMHAVAVQFAKHATPDNVETVLSRFLSGSERESRASEAVLVQLRSDEFLDQFSARYADGTPYQKDRLFRFIASNKTAAAFDVGSRLLAKHHSTIDDQNLANHLIQLSAIDDKSISENVREMLSSANAGERYAALAVAPSVFSKEELAEVSARFLGNDKLISDPITSFLLRRI